MHEEDQLALRPQQHKSVGELLAVDKSMRPKPIRLKNTWVTDTHSMDSPRNISLSSITQDEPPAPMKKSTGFYVDMSDDSANEVPDSESTANPKQPNGKKHLFSMFIDFAQSNGISPTKTNRISAPRLCSSMQRLDHTETPDAGNVVLRKKTSSKRPEVQLNRHSWNTGNDTNMFPFDTIAPTEEIIREDSCSASVTSGDHGYQSMPMQPKSVRSLSINSRNSVNSIYSSHEDVVTLRPQRESSLSDSYSKDSVESYPESKRESSISDAEDVTYIHSVDADDMKRRNTSFNNFKNASLTFVRKSTDPVLRRDSDKHLYIEEPNQRTQSRRQRPTSQPLPSAHEVQHLVEQSGKKTRPHTMESLQATIEKQQKLLLETVNEETPLSSFVRLSDMDKPVPRAEWNGPAKTKKKTASAATEQKLSRSAGSTGNVGRMERMLAEHNQRNNARSGAQMSRSMGTNLTNLASSIDTLRSLSRLFPHLSDELNSQGLPVEEAPEEPSPLRTTLDHQEYVLSDLSATSSVTSSFSRSGIDSADEWSLSCRQPRRLGEDLLKMFLQELATDVTIDVSGRPIRAHKCILRSRCQYFAAMLAGEDGHKSRISLPGYSFGSVHFALCHIYSGAAHPPHGISLFELAALGDMLALEGLKEVTTFALRSHFCHNFHKPCSGCIDGILQVFPVSLQHGLDDLYHKCLRWTCKHYVTVWPTRAFAQLPSDMIERCTQYLVAHVNSETVLTLILNCDHLVTVLSSCRWAIGVENTVRDLIDTARAYIADHFANLLASDCFLSLGQDQSANITRLENLLLRTASTLTPEQSCRSYQRATRLNNALRSKVANASSLEEDPHWNSEFLRFVEAILLAVEQCLTRQCARAMRTQHWQRMELDLRKRIQSLACLTDSMESKRSTKHLAQEGAIWNNDHHVPDMQQVKMAIETLSRRSKEGRYKNTEINPDRNLDKVTKLRKPAAVSTVQTTQLRPASVHVAHPRPVAEITKLRTFKHSISLDATKPTPKPKQVSRFAEIRPRYLEPKTRFSTQSVDNLTQTHGAPDKPRQIGSSMKSINSIGLSRDSLVPAKRKQSRSHTNMSKDSLNSALTGARTNKSMSRESLVKFHAMSTVSRLKKPASLSGNSSTDHSPTTTRSSRLSSGPSCGSSPRTALTRRTLSNVAEPPQPRKSFLSAKSREILAAKKTSLNRAESVRVVATSTPMTDGRTLNKSSSVSHIPARRPPIHPTATTLHLRRTAKVVVSSSDPNIGSKVVTAPMDARSKKATATATNMRIKSEMEEKEKEERKNKKLVEGGTSAATERVESRMERSITFCKDSSDFPDVIELTIVE